MQTQYSKSELYTHRSGFGELALTLTDKFGSRFFPCDQLTKLPMEKWREIPITLERIQQWVTEFPDAAIGMVLGNGLAAIDCDLDADEAAIEAWNTAHNETESRGTLLCRSRAGSERWLTTIRVSEPFKKGVLKFNGHTPKVDSRAIELLCEGQYCIVSRNGYHYEGDALWDVEQSDLPHLSGDEIANLVKTIGDVVCAELDWTIESNTISGALRLAPDESEGFNTQTGLDLPLFQRRDAAAFVLKPEGLGMADVGREDWLKAIQSAVDLLRDDPEMKEFVTSCSESKSFADWESITEKEIDYALDRYHNSGNVTGAYILGLSIFSKNSNNKTSWLKYEKTQQSTRSRKRFLDYSTKLDSVENSDYETEESIELEISQDDILTERDRLKLAPLCQKRLVAIGGEKRSIDEVRKSIAFDGETSVSSESVKKPIPLLIVEEILANSKAVKDQHGNFHIVDKRSGSNSHIEILSSLFSEHCQRLALSLGAMIDDRTCNTIAANVVATLRTRTKIVELPLRQRVAQIGSGGEDDPTSILVDPCDSNATDIVFRIDGEVVRSIPAIDAGVLFDKGASAAEMKLREKDDRPLSERVVALWRHLRVTPQDRMICLGVIVNNYFREHHQPIVVLHSNEGETAKSPTAYYMRQLMDPQSEELSGAPSDRTSFVRTICSNRVTVFDDVDLGAMPTKWQASLNGFSMNGTETVKRLYSSTGTITMDAAGATIITTNHASILSVPQTRERAVYFKFCTNPQVGAKKPSMYRAEFTEALPELQRTVLELVSEVIQVLPSITEYTGHRNKGLVQVVNALHKILGVEGSFAQTMDLQLKSQVPDLMNAHPFIMDTINFILSYHSTERSVDISPRRLIQRLLDISPHSSLMLLRTLRSGDRSNNYPLDGEAGREALTGSPDVLALLGLEVSIPPCKTNKNGRLTPARDKGGPCLRITLNENAPSAEDVPFDIIAAVERMRRTGQSIPNEWEELYFDAISETV